MSGAVLRSAVTDRLANKLALNDTAIGMQDGAQPFHLSGELYISIHPGGVQTASVDYGLLRIYGLQVTISLIGTRFIRDSWGVTLLGNTAEAIEFVAERVIAEIHKDIALIGEANEKITGQSSKFNTGVPMVFDGAGEPQHQPASWWGRTSNHKGDIGMSYTLRFGGAERHQSVGEIDPLVTGV